MAKKNTAKAKSKEKTRDIVDDILEGNKGEEQLSVSVKDVFYGIGVSSRHAVNMCKNMIGSDLYKKTGKKMGALQKDLEAGWKSPDKVFGKDKVKLEGQTVGVILGSCTKCGIDQLNQVTKGVTNCLCIGYKKGSRGVLIQMWKAKHLKASKSEQEKAIETIEELFKIKD